MLRRLNAQEEATLRAPLQSESDDQGGSTGGELFVPRPSRLKETFTETSEEDLDDVIGPGRNSRMCVHHRQKSPLARASLVITAVETTVSGSKIR